MSDPFISPSGPIPTPGPFEVRCDAEAETVCIPATPETLRTDLPTSTQEIPRRLYDCESYEICLGLAASLNWESFTCRGCCGQPNENLLWRARVTARKDSVAARLLKAPPIVPLNSLQSGLRKEQDTPSAG